MSERQTPQHNSPLDTLAAPIEDSRSEALRGLGAYRSVNVAACINHIQTECETDGVIDSQLRELLRIRRSAVESAALLNERISREHDAQERLATATNEYMDHIISLRGYEAQMALSTYLSVREGCEATIAVAEQAKAEIGPISDWLTDIDEKIRSLEIRVEKIAKLAQALGEVAVVAAELDDSFVSELPVPYTTSTDVGIPASKQVGPSDRDYTPERVLPVHDENTSNTTAINTEVLEFKAPLRKRRHTPLAFTDEKVTKQS